MGEADVDVGCEKLPRQELDAHRSHVQSTPRHMSSHLHFQLFIVSSSRQPQQLAMNSLISYASSDDEEETQQTTSQLAKAALPTPAPQTQPTQPQPEAQEIASLPEQQPTAPPQLESPGSSPYTTTRTTLRNLTMPPTPNFSIPASPPPPPTNSESSATLAARTKKFEKFLELKRQGVHFNARLQGSSALRNPALLDKLMAFAGIGREDAYKSSLGEGLGVAVQWPAECEASALVKTNERREKKQQKRGVEFVSEGAGKGKKARFDR